MEQPKTLKIDDVEYVRTDSIKEKAQELDGLTYCIIRTYSSGCFAGYIDRNRENQKEATVKQARRLWYWNGAASLSQLSVDGVSKPEDCQFPVEVAELDLSEIIEVIPATEKAKNSIAKVTIWEK